MRQQALTAEGKISTMQCPGKTAVRRHYRRIPHRACMQFGLRTCIESVPPSIQEKRNVQRGRAVAVRPQEQRLHRGAVRRCERAKAQLHTENVQKITSSVQNERWWLHEHNQPVNMYIR